MKRVLLSLIVLLPAFIDIVAYDFEQDGIFYTKTEATQTATVVKETTGNSTYTGDIIIPATVSYEGITYTVTAIGDDAFYYSTVTSVTLPNTIKEIGGTSFKSCNNLTHIELPESLEKIGISAFARSALTEITIPANVTTMLFNGWLVNYYSGTFEGCTALSSVTFAEGSKLKTLPQQIFAGCTSLNSVVLPEVLTSIGIRAFGMGQNGEGCKNLKNIVLPSGLQIIGDMAFNYSGLTQITIPQSVTRIDRRPFDNSQNLETIVLEEGIGDILSESIFYGLTNLKNVSLPSSITKIPKYAFNNCKSLASITLPENTVQIDDYAFYGCTALASIELPSKLTTIGEYAFYQCTNLTLNLPASVQTIGECALYAVPTINVADYDQWSFLVLNEDLFRTKWGHVYYNNELITHYTFPDDVLEIPECRFYGCTDIVSVTIPQNVIKIGKAAFRDCINLLSADIKGPVKLIDEQAFYNCKLLENIVFPNSLETIGSSAFCLCDALTNVTFGNGLKEIGQSAFYGCKSLQKVDIGDITNWCNVVFSGTSSRGINDGNPLSISKKVYLNGLELTELTIPTGVEKIGDFVFNNCTSLTKLTITDGAGAIGNYAFSNCTGLTSIELPSSVHSLGDGAFYGCTGITAFNLPEGLTEIAPYLFYGCTNLATVTTHSGITSIGDYAFNECTNLAGFVIPEEVETIKRYAFKSCHSLTSINMPNSVTTVGIGAFNDCTGLTAVHIKDLAAWCNIKYVYQYNQGAGTGMAWEPQYMASNPLKMAHYLYLNNEKITELTIPKGVKDITPVSFCGLKDVEVVNIPSSVESIGALAFVESSIRTLCCASANPPVIYNYKVVLQYNTFQREDEPRTGFYQYYTRFDNLPLLHIYVPKGCGSAYKASWTDHENVIEETEISAIIDFADDEVKRVCIENWDTDGDGELSMAEAMAVTDIGEKFRNNRIITSFDEFKYFTGVTILKYAAFELCQKLETITLPNSLTEIEQAVFAHCQALKGIKIPASVTKMTYLGTSYTNMESMTVEEGNPMYDSRNNCNAIIETATNRIISGCQKTVIPETVTTIGNWAFDFCLKDPIEIPEGVTTIEYGGFFGNLFKSIVLPSTLTDMTSAFYQCSNLIAVESHIMQPFALDERTFDMAEHATLFVPKGTKELYAATEGWNKFRSIVETEEETEGNVIAFADPETEHICLENWDFNQSGKLSYAEAAAVIDLGLAFYENTAITQFDELQHFTGVKSIHMHAFREDNKLTSIKLPPSLEVIESSAFLRTRQLATLELPESLTTIEEAGLRGCGFTSVEIPQGVTTIGERALYDCRNLTSVTVNWQSPLQITENTFSNYDKMTLTVPKGTKDAYLAADYWKDFMNIVEAGTTVELIPIEGETAIAAENLNTESLTNNVVNGVYYNVGTEGYDATDKSVVISQVTNMGAIGDTTPGSADVQSNFTGMILKVAQGKGTITLNVKTSGNALLVVQVGNGTPMVASKTEQGDVVVNYDVQQDTYVYIYAILGSSSAPYRRAAATDVVKIYGINVQPGATGITNIGQSLSGTDSYYTLDGCKVEGLPPKKGIYIVNGRKAVIK